MEALKAEKERTEEEKQAIAEKLMLQNTELQSHYQVPKLFLLVFSPCHHRLLYSAKSFNYVCHSLLTLNGDFDFEKHILGH
jgi:hypothetical protein